MKKLFFITVIVAFVLTAGVAFAQSKIGVVNFASLLERSTSGKSVRGDMEKQFSARDKSMKSKQDEINHLGSDLEKQSMALKQEVKQGKEEELRRKVMEFQKLAMELERDRQAASERLMRPLMEKAQRVVTDFAKKNGYGLIFDVSGQVLYFDSNFDATDALLSEFNKAK